MGLPLKKYWNLLDEHLKKYKGKVMILGLLIVTSIIVQLTIPQILRTYIDDAFASVDAAKLTFLAFLVIILSIIQQIVTISSLYVGTDVAWLSTNSLREKLFSHCINLDMKFHNQKQAGELVERIDGDVTGLAMFFTQFVFRILVSVLLLLAILVIFFLEDPIIGIIFTSFSIISLISIYLIRNIAVPATKDWRQSEAELFAFLQESLSGTEDINALGAKDYELKRLHGFEKSRFLKEKRMVKLQLSFPIIVYIIIGVSLVLAFASGYPLLTEGIITLGTSFSLYYYTLLLGEPLIELTRQIWAFQNIEANISRINDLLDHQKEINPGKTVSYDSKFNLHFDKVNFSYEENNPVLKDISFTLNSGESLGLVGRTGSGKTTISRLVFRFYDPQYGEIKLNNINIREFTLKSLRTEVAMVTQDIEIFNAPLRDNITFFDKSFSDEEILRALLDVGLENWYNELSNGLDTIIKSGKDGLSAGESQLLAFSRVFLKNPKIIILDEATSHLDPLTENLIEIAVKKLLEGRTSIIIAHKLSTLEQVDKIMILEDGSILEYDKREILNKNTLSRYSQLKKNGNLEEVLQ